MSDKLLIEIEMCNGEINNAVPALIFLAHELSESGTIEINDPVNWKERTGLDYEVKWRFAEDECHIPFDIEDLYDLHRELQIIAGRSAKNQSRTISAFLNKLQSELNERSTELYAEAALLSL